jgi:hypothetical protein
MPFWGELMAQEKRQHAHHFFPMSTRRSMSWASPHSRYMVRLKAKELGSPIVSEAAQVAGMHRGGFHLLESLVRPNEMSCVDPRD